MAKFHVNNEGNPGQCTAQNGGCPFGGEAQHYSTPEIARQAFELSLASESIPAVVSKAPPAAAPIIPPADPEQVFVDDFLATKGAAYLGHGDMVAVIDGKPKLVNLTYDPTSPYPMVNTFGRTVGLGAIYDSEEAIEKWNEFKEDGRQAIDSSIRQEQVPIFDSFDADLSYAARERTGVLHARQQAYQNILNALEATPNKEAAADRLIAEQKVSDPRPEGRATTDAVQRWQARVNTMSEFVLCVQPSNDRARWALENARPVEYLYSQGE